uniref:CSON013386 protein n=1 Tax=Culicoides sonorensis TaxID=179676 RepID=A0A336KPR1_CULSO
MSHNNQKSLEYKLSCRICLKSLENTRGCIKLFELKNDLLPASVISILANVDVNPDDDLPQQLCNTCWKKVNASFCLKQEIEKSDKILRNLIEGNISDIVKTELIEESDDKKEIDTNDKESSGNVTPIEDNFKDDEDSKSNDDCKDELDSKTKRKKNNPPCTSPRCCMCRFICKTKDELKSHVDEMHPNPRHKSIKNYKDIQCQYCFKGFKTNRTYTDHFRYQYIERSHQCAQCGQTYAYISDLIYHEDVTHSDTFLACEICKKKFRTPRNLRRHMKVHDERSKLICDICSRSYSEKKQLEYHIRSHINTKEFFCQFCKKGFVHKNLLKIHTRKHTGERPYKCFCGKAYMHNTDLKRHQYEHQGVKPFKCNFCDRTFYQNSNRKVHERVHTMEQPFSCNVCGQKFKFHAHWKSHEKKHQEQMQ